MRIACIGYRKWALDIYDAMANSSKECYLIFRSKEQYNEKVLKDFKPDLVLFYGWSWMVSDSLLREFTCLMLHPSPLPKYRGGSPIQNQIICGEKSSKVSIFIMNDKLDAGDLVAQAEISLQGSLDDIFDRIKSEGLRLTRELILEGMKPWPQKHDEATYCKRRAECESEITREELNTKTATYLYDKVRMLADPYPNAFIKTKDGKKLVILSTRIDEN